jgi:ABC-2 type transport system permease protein
MSVSLPVKSVSPFRLFQSLRWNVLRNGIRLQLRSAPIRLLTILLCSLLIWWVLFGLSALGFPFIHEKVPPEFRDRIFTILFNLMFMALTVLLLFSTGIILYNSLFTSPEAAFLLSTPAPADQVFAYRFQGAVGFSSWAFVLLGSPLLIGYGLFGQPGGAPWYFYPILLLFFVGFLLLPGSLGALFCLLVVNYFPRRRKQMLHLGGLLVLAFAGWRLYLLLRLGRRGMADSDWAEQLLGQFAFLQGPLVPGHWMTRGLLAAARGDLVPMAYNLALVWSNGLFLYLLTAWIASRLYRGAYNRVATGGSERRRYGGSWIDSLISNLIPFLSSQTRLLIVKDFRTFRRDPAQWAQIAIFLILSVLYFSNLRWFYQQEIGRAFQNGISLLNLSYVALLLCAFTGRFIFPMLSLEGRKFWILGLLPLRRERLLWGKFAFAATGSILIAEFMVVFSDVMLGISWQVVLVHVVTVVVIALGLSGLSVGLGACLPNFQESDPSKIAVGFGGTLNLLAGLLYLVLVIGLMAAPWHLYLVLSGSFEMRLESALWWLLASSAAGLAVGVVGTILPLRAGARALRIMEF